MSKEIKTEEQHEIKCFEDKKQPRHSLRVSLDDNNLNIITSAECNNDLGIQNDDLLKSIINSISCYVAGSDKDRFNEKANYAIANFVGFEPKNETEAMLASQMTVTHLLAMEMAKKANLNEQTPEGVDSNVNRMAKLMRTFNHQIETLKKLRTGGKQTIQVQHVNVNEGGQAVVGNVSKGEG